jgi:hypothetical protein
MRWAPRAQAVAFASARRRQPAPEFPADAKIVLMKSGEDAQDASGDATEKNAYELTFPAALGRRRVAAYESTITVRRRRKEAAFPRHRGRRFNHALNTAREGIRPSASLRTACPAGLKRSRSVPLDCGG